MPPRCGNATLREKEVDAERYGRFYFLVFIHIDTRQIWISPCTETQNGPWTTQQGRNFQMHLQDEGLTCELLHA